METIPSITAGSAASDRPGTLLRAEPLTTVPENGRGYRVTYRSQSIAGAPIDVTGIVIVPKTKAPPNGWPVLSYAHGTVGLADRCTPSNKLSDIELTLATAFNAAGIAVVASDFEGLGTPGRHPYLVGESEGRGVLDIVRAARQLPNEKLSGRFAVWGHSQGGHAALFAGEIAKSWAPELTLMGVVAGAPPSQLTAVGDSLENSPFRGYVFMVAAGMHAAYPNLDLSKVLTPKGLETLKVVDTGCNREVFRAFASGPLDDFLRRDGLADPQWQEAFRRNEPGQRKTPAPILIVHGDKDEQIPVATSAALRTKLCGLGNNVDRRVYRNQDHGGAAVASLFDVLTWLGARSLGLPARNRC
jgi:pimeloyl-ACP methyl ester carboxylesterase